MSNTVAYSVVQQTTADHKQSRQVPNQPLSPLPVPRWRWVDATKWHVPQGEPAENWHGNCHAQTGQLNEWATREGWDEN